MKKTTSYGVEKDGWVATYGAGNFGDDIILRDSINFGGIWANTTNEAIYFGGTKDAGSNQLLNGNNTYKIVFSKDELPDLMADAFWSITLYNTPDYHVAKNALKVTAVSSSFNNILKEYTKTNIDLLPNIVDDFFFQKEFLILLFYPFIFIYTNDRHQTF